MCSMSDRGHSAVRDVMERCPQVFVVDNQAQGPHTPCRVPVKLDTKRLSLIYLLLAVALLSIFIEAGFIYHLYNRPAVSTDIQKLEYSKGEKNSYPSSSHDLNGKTPKDEKPAAFLQGSSPPSGANGVLHWRSDSFPGFFRGLDFKNNSLYFQQEGYYYIFSKIFHLQKCNFFKHQIMLCSERYNYLPIELIQNSRYVCISEKTQLKENSYLGGIFHLNKGDSVFVQVNNRSQVPTSNNYFGAFII
ncbi:tumor necrosis factor ligand superfamily member 14-like [Myxocyprinus asiaticus]|uniref:tumor necrosis factor ligand superfamily member 14-like n=1 Tax=Myxocyprinus asiaticus TaxID=70543 RepID=UPI0022226F94|nr:tumor necrosis factor ligand superfamily member 14-like [Myxocyprinus asiaticus]XP_051558097.1 tumor necrosis factor ligand superfamily member 14-like [Myxocyprinus asiaticus]XP_051558098.1 tumor necrosis factor ligand superfamily member 14-like [Myxocyprinus asiaticus]XP_051558099.1 tumor necrosis factor ligand superfamily member 14-like [Myxocyprinus asiaticus]XP_051558100.1 tumor necrosis factor ligand superfamily member 14-like [Myxocyprinus asiaticus]XP_051558101.1 tumor necrosis facto